MGNMTDVSANEPKVFARCQQEFINRHVCICRRLSIRPSLSARLAVTAAVCCRSAQWLWAQTSSGASILQSSHLQGRFGSSGFTLWHDVGTQKKIGKLFWLWVGNSEFKTFGTKFKTECNTLARKLCLWKMVASNVKIWIQMGFLKSCSSILPSSDRGSVLFSILQWFQLILCIKKHQSTLYREAKDLHGHDFSWLFCESRSQCGEEGCLERLSQTLL